jgi:hypothetical protein
VHAGFSVEMHHTVRIGGELSKDVDRSSQGVQQPPDRFARPALDERCKGTWVVRW